MSVFSWINALLFFNIFINVYRIDPRSFYQMISRTSQQLQDRPVFCYIYIVLYVLLFTYHGVNFQKVSYNITLQKNISAIYNQWHCLFSEDVFHCELFGREREYFPHSNPISRLTQSFSERLFNNFSLFSSFVTLHAKSIDILRKPRKVRSYFPIPWSWNYPS